MESHPVETLEYAVAQEIYHDPAFKWWVKAVLKKRMRVISLVKRINARYLNKTHKFVIEVPKSVAQAYTLDKKNGNNLWENAIAKDMKDVRPTFKKLEDGEIVPIGYQRVNCHMIFDIKTEDLRWTTRLVAGGHVTEPLATIMYARKVLREIVRIALTLAALNDLPSKVADIQNTYITSPVIERIWTVLCQDFREDAERKATVVRTLYVLKSTGAVFGNHLED